MKLRPVTYNISNDAIAALTRVKDDKNFPGKHDGEKVTYTGFLAQEVEQAALSTGYDFSVKQIILNTWQVVVPQKQELVIMKKIALIAALEWHSAAFPFCKRTVVKKRGGRPLKGGNCYAAGNIVTTCSASIDASYESFGLVKNGLNGWAPADNGT